MESRKRAGSDIATKKTGRPLTLDEETDMEAQQYLFALHEAGGAVNGAIARASAMDILRRINSS